MESSPPYDPLAMLLRTDGVGDKIYGHLDNQDWVALTRVSTQVSAAAKALAEKWARNIEAGGHGLGKHCLTMLSLHWDPVAIMGQFDKKTKGGKAIRGAVTPIQVAIEQAKKKPPLPAIAMTTTVVLRLRVIGIDPITKLLEDEDPNKSKSCAFRTPLTFSIAARRMLELLMEYRATKKKDCTGELLVGPTGSVQHRVTFEYRPKQGGYGVLAPVEAIFGPKPASALIGFIPTQRFVDMAATIRQLAALLKSNRMNDANGFAYVLIKVSEAVSAEVSSFAGGKIKAVIKPLDDGGYELFSLYPEAAFNT